MFIDQERLNQVLDGNVDVLNKVLEEVSVKTVETTLRSIPAMISRLVQVTSMTADLVKDVYEKNPEFKDHKQLVVDTIQEVDSQNSGLPYNEVIEKAVPVIRRKIEEFKSISNIPTGMPSIQSIEQRLNGAI